MTVDDLNDMLSPGVTAHLVGIGGVSMSPLAEALTIQGVRVTGCDEKDGANVRRLQDMGIPVHIGHAPKHLDGTALVIRTAAARDDNAEIAEARKLGIPVFERAQAWGHIMRGYKNSVCVAGAHGKTTATSMIAQILLAANSDPTIMIGGTLPMLGSGCRVGRGDTIVLESCEYMDSFLSFYPTVAVVLNIDAEHLDYFGDLDGVKASFRKFASLVPENGYIIMNGCDENTVDALRGIDREVVTFGADKTCDVRCESVKQQGSGTRFDVVYDDRVYCRLHLRVPGDFNVQNALAACAVAITLGIPGETVEEALGSFTGAGRRFEYKGGYNGADVYDDYAHHPNELKPLLDMAKTLPYERILLAFQPHTYSRTHAHFDAFVTQLKRADKVYLAEIYAAREVNTIGISSYNLSREVPGSVFVPDFKEMEQMLAADAQPGDLILTVGAGELYLVGEALCNRT